MKASVISKLIAVILVLILTVSTITVSVYAQADMSPRFEVSSTNALCGEEFSVELTINNNPGITGLQLCVEYDEDKLELLEISDKNLFKNGVTSSKDFTSPFKISWYSQRSEDEDSSGVLVTLKFRALESAKTTATQISLSYDCENVFDSNFNNVYFDTSSGVVKIQDCLYGDVDKNKIVNMKDIAALQMYLNHYSVDIDINASDVYHDNSINMKDIAYLQQYLNGYDVVLGEGRAVTQDELYTSFVYGKSEMGKDLICHSFTPEKYNDTVLLNFAIHGFEDEYNADGQVLVDAANELIEYYKSNPDKLCDTRLLIIPCANPDGLLDGNTNNGFGRCNAKGIDLNRDFDANYISQSTARNYTPYAFSGAESRALRDLVLDYSADVVLDIHGWLNETIGDYELAQIFEEEMSLEHYVNFTSSNSRGYFANWAHQQGALGLLVELTNSNTVRIDGMKRAIDRILSKNYLYSDLDDRFAKLTPINCYANSDDRVNTFKYFNKSFSGNSYIDGAVDLCTISKVYSNGWVRVEYPTTSGSKVAFCRLNEFVSDDTILDKFYTMRVEQNTSVYRKSNLSEKFGTVYPTDEITVIAQNDNRLQIIYPLDNGGYKMGWINKV